MIRPTIPTTSRMLTLLSVVAVLAPGLASGQNSFDWYIEDQGSVQEMLILREFHTDIINTGTVTDTYQITLTRDMHPDWATSMCDTQLCYPPFITTLEYTLAPGDSIFVGINITPATEPGSGTATVMVSSANVPANVISAEFTVVSTDLEVLLVDADFGAAGEGALIASLAASGRTSAVWDRSLAGKLAAPELAAFPTVLWHAGGNLLGLDDDDRAALATYVQGGGTLLVTGENLAFAVADPISPFQDPAAHSWLQNNLFVQYVAGDAGVSGVTGVGGDPVGSGLGFAIDGGVGAPLPDVVAPVNGGVTGLVYAGGQSAGVRGTTGAGKTLFLPFAFDRIVAAADRDALLTATLAWFADGASAAADVPASLLADLRAFPNPFNPNTSIGFFLGGTRPSPVKVTVYDVAGRTVRRVFAGVRAPGVQRFSWDGRDERGRTVAGGLYIARVTVAEATSHIKMVLAK